MSKRNRSDQYSVITSDNSDINHDNIEKQVMEKTEGRNQKKVEDAVLYTFP